VGTYVLSGLVLLALPLAAVPGWLPSASKSLAAVVLLWCVYHVLEYLGSVALWSWIGDLAPWRTRGRFLGRRERWMVAGQAAAMIAAGLLSYVCHEVFPKKDYPGMAWVAYAIPATLGACCLVASVVFLLRTAHPNPTRNAAPRVTLAAMLAPFADRRFVRLLCFGCWFSFFNGLTQTAQEMYPLQLLGISLLVNNSMRVGMRAGQFGISPWMGRLADRFGNRRVMMACLPIVATGTLFFMAATPQAWGWVAGAWIVWIAYAGVNVCLPNLMLRLSPAPARTAYVAAFETARGLSVAASILLGGLAADYLRNETFVLFGGAWVLDCQQWMFFFGWATRTMGVLVLLLVLEPARSATHRA
jgi:MFS family permease